MRLTSFFVLALCAATLFAPLAAASVAAGAQPLRACGPSARLRAPSASVSAGGLTGSLSGAEVAFADADNAWRVALTLTQRQARLGAARAVPAGLFSCPLSGGDARLTSGALVATDAGAPLEVAQWLESHSGANALEHSVVIFSGPASGSFALSFDVAASPGVITGLEASSGAFVASARGARVLSLSAPVAWDAEGTRVAVAFATRAAGGLALELTLPAGAVYPITVDPFATTPAWSIEGTQHEEMFGHRIAVGDLNADGSVDLAIGSPSYDIQRGFDAGRVTIVLGSGSAFESVPDGTLELPANYIDWYDVQRASFGVDLAIGDMDGNGYAELLVGCPNAGDPTTQTDHQQEGIAFLYKDSYCSSACSAPCTTSQSQSTVITTQTTTEEYYVASSSPTGVLGTVKGIDKVAVTETASAVTTTEELVSETWEITAASLDNGKCEWYIGQYFRFDSDWGHGFLWHAHVDSSWPTSQITVDFFYRGTDTGANSCIFCYSSSASVNTFVVREPKSLTVAARNDFLSNVIAVNDGDWHHVAVSYRASDGDIRVIVDGAQVGFRDMSNNRAVSGSGSFLWGNRLANYRERYIQASNNLENSDLADLRIWSTYRDASETLDSIGCATPPSAGDLWARWTFDNVAPIRSTFEVIDSVGNTNIGIVNGRVSPPESAFPRASGSSSYKVTMVRTVNTTTVTTTSTCTGACDGSSGCRWTLAQEDPYSDRSGTYGLIGSAVAFGNAATSGTGSGAWVGRHYSSGVGRVYGWSSASQFGSGTSRSSFTNPQGGSDKEGYGMFGNRLYAGADLLNNDGIVDVVVGAPRHSTPTGSGGIGYQGRVLVYQGRASTTVDGTADWIADGPDINSGFGRFITSADVNNDGFADLLVSAPYLSTTVSNEGAVLVFPGSASGLGSTTPAQTLAGRVLYGLFGTAVADAGDINNDGCPDIVVGAPGTGPNRRGAVLVHRGCIGPGGYLATTPSQTIAGTVSGGMFGQSLAAVGDLDGDGWVDILASHPLFFSAATPTIARGRIVLLRGLPMADLSVVSLVAPPAPVATPNSFAVVATFANLGPATATSGVATFGYDTDDGLVLTGVTPSGITIGSCTTAAHATLPNRMVTSCPFASLTVAAGSVSLTYNFDTSVDTPQRSFTASFNVIAAEVDENGASTTAAFSTIANVDLTVAFLSVPPTVVLGELITFVVEVTTNPSMVTAANVRLVANLPTDAFFYQSIVAKTDSTTNNVACFSTMTCSIPRLRAGQSFNVTYTLRVLNGITTLLVGDDYSQTFTVSTDSTDVALGDNSITSGTYSIVEPCDLVVDIVASPSNLAAGAPNLNLVTAFSNVGTVFCSDVVATIALPPGLTLVSQIISPGATCNPYAADKLVCNMAVSTTASRLFSFTFDTPSNSDAPITALLYTTQSTFDLDYSNNNDSDTVTTFFATDAAVSVFTHSQISPLPLLPNVPGTFVLRASSVGASDLADGTISLAFTDASAVASVVVTTAPPGTNCVVSGSNVTCDVIHVVSAAGVNFFDIVLSVTADWNSATSLVANAWISSASRTDVNPGNNAVTRTQALNKFADVSIQAAFPSGNIAQGSLTQISMSVSSVANGLGPNLPADVAITLELPPGTVYEGYDVGGYSGLTCSAAGTLVTCPYTVFDQAVELVVSVRPNYVGQRSYRANITQSRSELIYTDNTRSGSITTDEAADLAASFESNIPQGGTIVAASTLVLTARVENKGPATVSPLTAVFELPEQGTLDSVTPVAAGTTCGPTVPGTGTNPDRITCSVPGPLVSAPSVIVPLVTFSISFPLNLTIQQEASNSTGPSSRALEYIDVKAAITVSSSLVDENPGDNRAVFLRKTGDSAADVALFNYNGKADALNTRPAFAKFRANSVVFDNANILTGATLVAYNYGPSTALNNRIIVTLPGSSFVSNVAVALSSISPGTTVACSVTTTDTVATTVDCFADRIPTGGSFVVSASGSPVHTVNATVTLSAAITEASLVDPDLNDNQASFDQRFEVLPVAQQGETVAPQENSSSGLGWLLWLIIALGAALVLFFILGALGFFKRKKPPTESELEAEKAAQEMEMEGIDSDEILDVDDDDAGAVAEL